ncbi:hypothetical protein CY34DRAFT_19531 [Suillus luteus UH-Slu-Lm8-n1]|uniref:Uncharacterized protein n=1 Tax=Suillus luteus UH-Slu-Lm8-n1 TaxID=930992 RepID=A0A0C9ZR72_9AGAM|nr:hypothetical protein CY34DRAFT_19531 [Suillus luteus UH-Slu-Lm8-n1]
MTLSIFPESRLPVSRVAPKLSVSGLVLQRLFEHFPPATLFPNLCALGSHALRESSSDLSLVRMFMSPRLEELLFDVSARFTTHEVEQFLGALPIEAHGLRQLSISIDRGAMVFLPSFGKLPKLMALTIFGIDVCLTRQVITNIQQARCLNTLKLSLRGSSYDGGVMALELSSLEHLSLSGDDLPRCTHFIRQITTRQLSDVAIQYLQPASLIEITIRVVDGTYVENAELAIPLSSEVFRPLLKFTVLLSVDFNGIGNYNLDDRFIDDIPDAWPGIQVLKFASNRPASCTATFIAMVSLALRCRSLRSLHLTCDASQPTIVPQAEDGTERLWPAQTALRELHFGHSNVPEVASIPYILAKVFPALSSLRWYDFVGGFFIDNVSRPVLEEVWKQLKVLRGQDDEESDEDHWMGAV